MQKRVLSVFQAPKSLQKPYTNYTSTPVYRLTSHSKPRPNGTALQPWRRSCALVRELQPLRLCSPQHHASGVSIMFCSPWRAYARKAPTYIRVCYIIVADAFHVPQDLLRGLLG